MICEHCGKELEPIIVSYQGKDYPVSFRRCECHGAVKARKIEEAREAIRREREFKSKLYLSGIPERYWDADKIIPDERLDELKDRGLYLYGGTGTGKTTLACALAQRAMREGYTARFVKAYQLPALFRTYDDAAETLATPHLLVIDDIGSDAATEWGNTRLRAAIDARYDSMKPTIVTSNYSKDQLAKLLLRNVKDMTPRAIVSRLAEMTDSIEMDGEDLRKCQG